MTSGPVSADCEFCEIAAGRQIASMVYSDQDVVAFLDVRPATTGHLLIVPRAHAVGLADLDDRTGARMFAVARRLASALRASGLPCEGINLFLADGAAAGQEVFHAHLHLLPRTNGDGFGVRARFQRRDRADLDATAATIRSRLEASR